MRKWLFYLLICLALLAAGCSPRETTAISELVAPVSSPENPMVPPDWKLIRACEMRFDVPSIKFYVPPDLNEKNVRSTDSCVKQYTSVKLGIALDAVGGLSSPAASVRDYYSAKKDFRLEKINIQGRAAELITYYEPDSENLEENYRGFNFQAVLHVPRINQINGGSVKVYVIAMTPEEKDNALTILKSITFD